MYLSGSCGLEYTIDYTQSGKHQQKSYVGSSKYVGTHSEVGGSWIVFVVIVGLVGFFIYKMSLSNTPQLYPSSSTPYNHGRPHHSPPPPYGFKPEYTDSSKVELKNY